MDSSHDANGGGSGDAEQISKQRREGSAGDRVAKPQCRVISKDREAALIDRLRRYDQRPEYLQTPGPYPNTYNPEKRRIPFVFRTCERFPPLPEAPPTLDCNYHLVEPRVRAVVLSTEERFSGNKAATADVGQYDVSRGLRLCEERSPCVVVRELHASSGRRRSDASEAAPRTPSEELRRPSSPFWHSTLNQCSGGKISTTGVRDVNDFLVRRSASPGPIYKPQYSGIEAKSFAALFAKESRQLDSRPTSASDSPKQRCARCGNEESDGDDDHRAANDSTRALSHLSTWVSAPTINFGKPVVPFHNPNKVLSPPPPPEVLAILAAASSRRKQPSSHRCSGEESRVGGHVDSTMLSSGGGDTLQVTTSTLPAVAEQDADPRGATHERTTEAVVEGERDIESPRAAVLGQDAQWEDSTRRSRDEMVDNDGDHHDLSHDRDDNPRDGREMAPPPYERFGGGHEVPTAAPTRPTSGASSRATGAARQEFNGQRHQPRPASALRLLESQRGMAAAVVMESPFHVVRPVPVHVSTHHGPITAEVVESLSLGGGGESDDATLIDFRRAAAARVGKRNFLRPATAAAGRQDGRVGGKMAGATDHEQRRKLILTDGVLSTNDYLHPLVLDRIADHVRLALGKKSHHHYHHQQQRQEPRKRYVPGGLTWASASKRGIAADNGPTVRLPKGEKVN